MGSPEKTAFQAIGWRRLFVVFLILGLFASFATNFWLFRHLKHFYAKELAVRLEPVGKTTTRSGDKTKMAVLFLGDSRAAAWPALPEKDFYTINGGTPAETTAQVLLGTETILTAENPKIVVIQAGINDLKAIGVFPHAAKEIQQLCLNNLIQMVERCRAHGANVVVTLIISPAKPGLARRLVWSNDIEPAVAAVNTALIQRYQNDGGVSVFNPNTLLSIGASTGCATCDYEDDLHLQPSAYQKLQPELLKLIGQWAEPKK